MKKVWLCLAVPFLTALLQAQETAADALSEQEAAAVAAILAKTAAQAEKPAEPEEKIILPEETKQEAFKEANPPQQDAAQQPAAKPEDKTPSAKPADGAPEETAAPAEAEEDGADQPKEVLKCLTVAYIDIDEAFNEHPRTIAVKEQIRLKILSKEEEVNGAKQLISVLEAENKRLAVQVRELKPYYERIVVEPQALKPQIQESADSLLLGNVLNRLTFSGAEILSTSPLNTPAELDDLTARIASNKKIIAERSLFIDNYKYTTREEILKLEKKEVNEILKDIYTEIKSFAKKRNIGAIVRKDEILYGEKPVNVTKDFISRLKKAKKYRKRGK
ncbi:hypothetical protein [Candidatus Avelusimicrobium alvi]|uniref:hypothetical protein n=1 Tax=Candidatus Avelusimicrobium alvi TaxID=3416221 RepID=UPI003D0A06B2